MPSIMPAAAAGAGTARRGGGRSRCGPGARISAREAATTPPTRRRVGTSAAGSAPPSRVRIRSAPARGRARRRARGWRSRRRPGPRSASAGGLAPERLLHDGQHLLGHRARRPRARRRSRPRSRRGRRRRAGRSRGPSGHRARAGRRPLRRTWSPRPRCLLTPLSGHCCHTLPHARYVPVTIVADETPLCLNLSSSAHLHTLIRATARVVGAARGRGTAGGTRWIHASAQAAVASNTALVLAAGAVVVYAVAADGYQAHEAELNDGGIWVVHGERRPLRPDQQADQPARHGRLRRAGGDRELDIVQDGAAVRRDRPQGRHRPGRRPRRPRSSTPAARSRVPSGGDLQMAGGTLASRRRRDRRPLGRARSTPQRGRAAQRHVLDRQSEPLDEVGEGAALAVTPGRHRDRHLRRPRAPSPTCVPRRATASTSRATEDLPEAPATPTAVTAVGEHRRHARRRHRRARRARRRHARRVPAGRVLQQAGPALGRRPGRQPRQPAERRPRPAARPPSSPRAQRRSRPSPSASAPAVRRVVRRTRATSTVQCGDDEADRVRRSAARRSNLVLPRQPRPDRAQRRHQRHASGTSTTARPRADRQLERLHRLEPRTRRTRTRRTRSRARATAARPRPKPDNYGARPGRTTVLHPLDNDSAPDGRLLSIVARSTQPTGGAPRPRSARTARPSSCRLPDDAAQHQLRLLHRRRPRAPPRHATVTRRRPRTTATTAQPQLRMGYEPRVWRGPGRRVARRPGAPRLARRLGRRRRRPRLGDRRRRRTRRAPSPAPPPTAGSASPAPRDGGEPVQVEYAVTDGRSATGQARRSTFRRPGPARPRGLRRRSPSPTSSAARWASRSRSGRSPTTCPAPTRSTPTPSSPSAASSRRRPAPTIKTDLENGAITFTAEQGAAPTSSTTTRPTATRRLDTGTVRVDVRPRPRPPGDPVAMPDTLTVFGQAAGIVDVLANDLDPAGGLLVGAARGRRRPQPARRGDHRRSLAAHLGAAGRAVAQPAARPLHDQQRHALGRRGRGRGQPAPGARRTTRRSPRTTGSRCAPAPR